MSGGVDSSVAAAIMIERGFQCAGVTLSLRKGESRCSSAEDINDAKEVARALGVKHHTLDFSEVFDKQVIRRFVEAYEQGITPNPCIDCNRRVKFNLALLDERLARLPGMESFDFIATGHYARITRDSASGRFLLRKAVDDKKDQSYALYCLTQRQLQRTIFPLGELSKNETRKIAEEKKFVNAVKKESQDICFAPDGNYGGFIEEYTGKKYPEGDIVDTEGKVVGRHRGIIRYTIGQRRGLGVAANVPIYVTAKSAVNNTVTLGPDSALFGKSLIAKDINLVALEDLKKPTRVTVKTRYSQEAQNAVAELIEDDTLRVDFDYPQRAITPGQAAVMYDGDIVVGGGTIL